MAHILLFWEVPIWFDREARNSGERGNADSPDRVKRNSWLGKR